MKKTSRDSNLLSLYGHKVRIRATALIRRQDKVLWVNHAGLNDDNTFWAFPGGGVVSGEAVETALRREVKEEVNLEVKKSDFLGLFEFLDPDLQSIELVFIVEVDNDEVTKKGHDPELNIIREIRWMDWEEVRAIPCCNRSIFTEEYLTLELFLNHRTFGN